MASLPSRWQASLMASAMILAHLPANEASIPPTPPAAHPSDLTPDELIRAADHAWTAGDWALAESHFSALIEMYRATPEMADCVRRARPLRVTARLRQKKLDAETLTLINETLVESTIDPVASDELAFWRGACHMHSGGWAEACSAFADYAAGKHAGVDALTEQAMRLRGARRGEALILQASCLLQLADPTAAAAFLEPHVATMRAQNRPELAGRLAVLRLQALVAAEQWEAALTLVRELYPRMDEITPIVALHTLCLQLGARFLESGRPYDALACFQRVWPRERIIAHQQSAKSRLSDRLARLRKQPGQEAMVIQIEGILNRLERESEAFSATESFDAALRLRVAAAYNDLGRAREAALVLEDMLARLPSDSVLEKAALSVIQCWMQVERWPRAVAAANAYLEKFRRPDNPDVPVVRFLKATAQHADCSPHHAELSFAAVHQLYPSNELAPRALFMEGICLLEQDLFREALDAFAETAQRFPKHEILDDATYWSAMALSFDKRHAEARDRLRNYLAAYGESARYATAARFRIAFSTFALADYPEAVVQFEQFIATAPDDPLGAEAHLLLGDALGALGRLDDAIAAYRRIDRSTHVRFYEEAVFRIGTVLKTSEQSQAMRAHFGKFLADHPTSPRLAEAVYWIGQSHRLAGDEEAARDVYWQVLATHGNDPAATGIEDVLDGMAKLYRGPAATEDLASRLAAFAAKARSGKGTLALRTRWARARVMARTQPEQARADLAALRPDVEVRHHHPRLIADCADALREIGRSDHARSLYLDLHKWHPRALEKDRAFLGLGLLAIEAGEPSQALEHFDRFERETLGSPHLGEVARWRARIHEEAGRFAEAQAAYERVLELSTASRQLKAQTLLALGDLMVRQHEDLKSTAYFERVYVSYGKYPAEVATAYAKRAAALERLGEDAAAMEVWRELAGKSELASFPETRRALERLKSLDAEKESTRNPGAATPSSALPDSTPGMMFDGPRRPRHRTSRPEPSPSIAFRLRSLIGPLVSRLTGCQTLARTDAPRGTGSPSTATEARSSDTGPTPNASSPADPWPDSITLTRGTTVRCRIMSVTEESIVIQYPPRPGSQAAALSRTLAWSDVKAVDFSMDSEFHRLVKVTDPRKDMPRLVARWTTLAPLLHRPHHPVGELGLALARLALVHPDPQTKHRALSVCEAIASCDWNHSRRHRARLLRAQLFSSAGKNEEASQEARSLVGDPLVAAATGMAAHVMLANLAFSQLRQIDSDHPRWMEDDTIRPKRESLYHQSLDHALSPSAFQGAVEEPATEGLWIAVSLLDYAGQRAAAANTARDLIHLYPKSPAATQAHSFLQRHQLPLDPTAATESHTAEPPASTEPPPPTSSTPAADPIVRRRPRYNPSPHPPDP
ncbi:MAG: tetratricopeptide repeat protein [Verrucomicrobiales bacterium]